MIEFKHDIKVILVTVAVVVALLFVYRTWQQIQTNTANIENISKFLIKAQNPPIKEEGNAREQ